MNSYRKEEPLFSEMPEEDTFDLYAVSHQELLNFIQEMPTGYRTVFNLVVFEEVSHREVADMLGISENASRSQFSRAKAILQKRVQSILKEKNLIH